jgi:hypothetical protein
MCDEAKGGKAQTASVTDSFWREGAGATREKRPTNLHNQRVMLIGLNFSIENDLEGNCVVCALQMPRKDQPAPEQDAAI